MLFLEISMKEHLASQWCGTPPSKMLGRQAGGRGLLFALLKLFR
jgi:hypothetical protein